MLEVGEKAPDFTIPSSHAAFCERLGGCPFPLLCDVLGEDGKRSRRAIYVIDKGSTIIHEVPWYQPGNVRQFMEIFQALGLE